MKKRWIFLFSGVHFLVSRLSMIFVISESYKRFDSPDFSTVPKTWIETIGEAAWATLDFPLMTLALPVLKSDGLFYLVSLSNSLLWGVGLWILIGKFQQNLR